MWNIPPVHKVTGSMSTTTIRRPSAGQVRVEIDATGTMVAATIADVGSPADGFVRGDRVAYPLSIGLGPVVAVDTLVGIPRNVSDRQAADLLAPGLLARAMIKQVRPFARGQRVAVPLGNSTISQVVSAWVASQAGLVVADSLEADVDYGGGARRHSSGPVLWQFRRPVRRHRRHPRRLPDGARHRRPDQRGERAGHRRL